MRNKVITKTQRLIIEDWDLKKKRQAIRIMDELRKKHKVRSREENSTQIIRHFRETRYPQ